MWVKVIEIPRHTTWDQIGTLLSLVEHQLWELDVAGSNPAVPTSHRVSPSDVVLVAIARTAARFLGGLVRYSCPRQDWGQATGDARDSPRYLAGKR